MKLTRKGLLKIVGDIVVNSPECPLSETLGNWNRTRDFDQDDFEGVVMLTVEEAKTVNDAIEWLCSTLEDYERERDNTPALFEGWKQMDLLDHRIEQASKQCESE